MRSPRRWPATSPARPSWSSSHSRPGRTWRPGTRWVPRSGGRSSGSRSTPIARTLLTWAVGVQRSGGSLRHLPQSLIELAELDFRVGRWVPALAGAYEAIALFEETAQRTELGFAQATIARMEAALGQDDDCRRRAQAGFAADAASGLLLASVLAGAALGLLELGRGEPEAAIVALEPVERIVREGKLGEPWLVQWAPDLIEAYSRVGRTDRAAGVLDTFERQAQATGRISAQAAAARCRGLLAPDDAFEGLFDAALALHELVPTPFERGRTELAYGERLRRAQKRTKARERLQSALQTSMARRGAVGGARPRRAARVRPVGADARAAGGGRAHAAGAPGRRPRRRWRDEPGGRRCPVPQREDDRVPPRHVYRKLGIRSRPSSHASSARRSNRRTNAARGGRAGSAAAP